MRRQFIFPRVAEKSGRQNTVARSLIQDFYAQTEDRDVWEWEMIWVTIMYYYFLLCGARGENHHSVYMNKAWSQRYVSPLKGDALQVR